MIKILKYLKKATPLILVIVALLFSQAFFDLSLPDYTAKIVNVGIQQGGIAEVTPKIIRKGQMDKILLFMDDASKDFVLGNYRSLQKNTLTDDEYENAVAKYPLLNQETLYELKQIDKDTIKKMDELISKPLLVVATVEKGSDEITELAAQMRRSFPKGTLSDHANIFDMMSLLPSAERVKILENMHDRTLELPDSMIQQAATSFVKAEYSAIGINMSRVQTNYIFVTGLKMLGLTLLSVVAAISVTFLSSRIAATLGMNLRSEVFNKVLSFSNQEINTFGTASLITRSTNDIQQIQSLLVMLFRMVVYAPILGVLGFFKAYQTNSSMSWIIGIGVIAVLLVVIVLYTLTIPRFKKLQQIIDQLNMVTREILTGLPVIRAFNNEQHEEKRFDGVNKDLTKVNLFVNRTMSIMMPTMMLIMNGISLLIIWVGAGRIDIGQMQLGNMMAFMQYAIQVVMAFLMVSMVSILLPRATVSAKRINEVLDKKEAINDPEKPMKFDGSKKGLVEFKDVSFRYPGALEDVLCNINFTAKPGETTAIIGSTGSGKSTLVNLIPRFFDVTDGKILLDGVDVRDATQHDLREKIGFIPQKGVLFSGTIESNIKFGNENATQDQIEQAAEIAQAYDFIEEKPEKFKSEISQGGTNVSGGQRQRLSIARAIVKDPEVYIFDDSFSALDYQTDVRLRQALKSKVKQSTVIIVAQRIGTIKDANQIVVLNEGEVVGIGMHTELMKSCEVYKQIALSQLSKEELV